MQRQVDFCNIEQEWSGFIDVAYYVNTYILYIYIYVIYMYCIYVYIWLPIYIIMYIYIVPNCSKLQPLHEASVDFLEKCPFDRDAVRQEIPGSMGKSSTRMEGMFFIYNIYVYIYIYTCTYKFMVFHVFSMFDDTG